MKYEYKVIAIESFAAYGKQGRYPDLEGKRFMSNGWAPTSEIEEAINKLADEGWEYLNPIVFPYTTDGEYLCHTLARLVFRREKA
jgi:hypothetical protein